MMKTFDFKESATQGRNPVAIAWLHENRSRPVTEEEYVTVMQSFKQFRTGRSSSYSPSQLKRDYKYLKKSFGLFQ